MVRVQLFIAHQATAAAAQANLIKQQEELERKAAELDRKEQELQNRTSGRSNPGGEKLQVYIALSEMFLIQLLEWTHRSH